MLEITPVMRRCCSIILAVWALNAAAVEVESLRMWPAPDNTRVVFDISGPVKYRIFQMSDPDRVVIDLFDTKLSGELRTPGDTGRLLERVRSARRSDDDLRIVLDLKRSASVRESLLAPNRRYGHRLVVDLIDPDPPKVPVAVKSAEDLEGGALRDIVVAIDAGHGGEDPGASGHRGTREKDIALAIARRLADRINAQRGMRAVLIRDGDYYVGLRQRIAKARAQRADLFLSLHADAFKDPRVGGSSVYVLSQRGASSEAARWLAERENASDFVGGVTLDDKDDLLASVLLDLSQTAALEASIQVADHVLAELSALGTVHKQRVQHAGFAVLKSPDIPSILVEMAFISNPKEEQRLRDIRHQNRMADALTLGIKQYFQESSPPGTLLAARKHRIAQGETLSTIAEQYHVSTDMLRMANNIRGDVVRAGEVLRIP